jgi:hypothetical protein
MISISSFDIIFLFLSVFYCPILTMTPNRHLLRWISKSELSPYYQQKTKRMHCLRSRIVIVCVVFPPSLIAVPLSEKFVATMEEEFPILERLFLAPSICGPGEEEIDIILPRTFQAHNLHHIHLTGVAFSIRTPLLTTTGGLRQLWLDGIPETAYFPPSYIVTHLSLMPQLEKLGISFGSDLPHPADTTNVTHWHVTLPTLRLIFFSVVSALAWTAFSLGSPHLFSALSMSISSMDSRPLSHGFFNSWSR